MKKLILFLVLLSFSKIHALDLYRLPGALFDIPEEKADDGAGVTLHREVSVGREKNVQPSLVLTPIAAKVYRNILGKCDCSGFAFIALQSKVFGPKVGDCLKGEGIDVITDMARRFGNELPALTKKKFVLDSVKELVEARDAEGCCDEYKQFLKQFLAMCDGVHSDVHEYVDPVQKIIAAYMILISNNQKRMVSVGLGLTDQDKLVMKHLFKPKQNNCCIIM